MVPVDFEEIERLQHGGKWDALADLLGRAAQQLERGGAGFGVLCTNAMHKTAAGIQDSIAIPLLHITDATAAKIQAYKIGKIGLLGTTFMTEHNSYKGRLEDNFVLEVLVPNDADRQIVHDIIYKKLCLGQVRDASRLDYRRNMADLEAQGVQGIILGCTEITLLVSPEDSSVPQFDTTFIQKELQCIFGSRSSEWA